MTLPKYFEMYRVFLETLKDGQIHSLKEIEPEVIRAFHLSEADVAELIPSGKQRTLYNRIGWCRTYLKKAGLVTNPAKGRLRITQSGLELLSQNTVINDDTLLQYGQFAEFKLGSSVKEHQAPVAEVSQKENTPREILEQAYQELNDALASELLATVIAMDPYDFERLVVELLVKMGYGKLHYNTLVTRKSGDEGIDGVVSADKLGFDSIYIQAKKFSEGAVGRPEIQKFVGALAGQGAQKGIFITTSRYTKEAEEFVEKNLNYKIVLIDGTRLSQLMIEYELGVSVEHVYQLKRLDSDYFGEE